MRSRLIIVRADRHVGALPGRFAASRGGRSSAPPGAECPSTICSKARATRALSQKCSPTGAARRTCPGPTCRAARRGSPSSSRVNRSRRSTPGPPACSFRALLLELRRRARWTPRRVLRSRLDLHTIGPRRFPPSCRTLGGGRHRLVDDRARPASDRLRVRADAVRRDRRRSARDRGQCARAHSHGTIQRRVMADHPVKTICSSATRPRSQRTPAPQRGVGRPSAPTSERRPAR